MRNVIGIDRKIRRAWLDALLDRLVDEPDIGQLRKFLEGLLRKELAGKESRAKTIGILLRIWATVPERLQSLRSRAIDMLPEIGGQDRIWLHWGMTVLAYPFFRGNAESIGRLLALQDDFTTAQVHGRIVPTWGDRTTTKKAANSVLGSMVDWEVLRAADKKGHFLLAKKIPPAPKALQLWLLEAHLMAASADEIEAHQLLRLPESYPFTFNVGVGDLRKHPGFVIHRQGLDMEMVALHVNRPQPAAAKKKNTAQPTLFDDLPEEAKCSRKRATADRPLAPTEPATSPPPLAPSDSLDLESKQRGVEKTLCDEDQRTRSERAPRRSMNFTGYTIFCGNGVGRTGIDGDFDAQGLAAKLVEEWIPFYECDKCGRADYCKYTQNDPHRAGRLLDIRCGVIVEAVTNFVQYTFPLLEKMTAVQVQAYLDGLFHLEQFLYSAEQATGWFINKDMLRFFGDSAPRYFGSVTHLREYLNKAASEFRQLPDFDSNKAVLFVEGQAEKTFLETLRESRLAWFLYLDVEVYGGRGNVRSKRIQMLLDRCVKQGYTIYIEGDADGRDSEMFRALCQKGSISQERSFAFTYDFETAIPSQMLYQALAKLGKLGGVECNEFETAIGNRNGSVTQLLRDKYHIDIDPLKVPLAKAVGGILNVPLFAWWQDREFMETELGRFLNFTMHIR